MENSDQKWKQEFALKEQEFLLSRGVSPRSSGPGYTLQVLDGGRLRALRSYPSRKKNNPNNGSR